MAEETLQIAVKRRDTRSKEERDNYKHLNVEFQRIDKRDKKAFLSNQCKEIEENYRMGKTRDLLKKIRDIKRTFHAKMVTIKDNMVQRQMLRSGKNTQKNCTKMIFMTQIIMMVWSLTRARHPGM